MQAISLDGSRGRRTFVQGPRIRRGRRAQLRQPFEAGKKLWQNPEYRAKIHEAKKCNTSLEKHNNISNALKLRWADDTYHAKMKDVRKQQATDEFKAKVSAGAKRRWQNPEYRAKMCAIRKLQAQRRKLK